jgi:hypothetical protein
VSRLIDGIEIATHQAVNPLPIDMKHLAVTGCSHAGKMALFAGAFDERIALTIPQESGGGGAPAWRVTHEIEAYGASEDIQRTSYEWFAGQMRQFSGLLGALTANTNVEVNPYPTLDYSRWTAWWGTQDPKFPNDWNPGDGSVIMSMTRPTSASDNGVGGSWSPTVTINYKP